MSISYRGSLLTVWLQKRVPNTQKRKTRLNDNRCAQCKVQHRMLFSKGLEYRTCRELDERRIISRHLAFRKKNSYGIRTSQIVWLAVDSFICICLQLLSEPNIDFKPK